MDEDTEHLQVQRSKVPSLGSQNGELVPEAGNMGKDCVRWF